MLLGGIMLSQCYPDSRNTKNATYKAAKEVIEKTGVNLLQMVDVRSRWERAEISKLFRQHSVLAVYCLTRLLNEEKCSLSSLDKSNRSQAVALVKKHLSSAEECGAQAVCLISGARPADLREESRHEAQKCLLDSFEQIIAYRQKNNPSLRIRLEPLDYFAHKKNTLGTIEELVALCSQLSHEGLPLGICLDTAHALLNGEDLQKAILQAVPWLEEVHLCNACADPQAPAYGDYHIYPGSPGALNIDDYQSIVHQLEQLPANLQVFAEYKVGKEETPPYRTLMDILQKSGVFMMRSPIWLGD